MADSTRWLYHLRALYGEAAAPGVLASLEARIDPHRGRLASSAATPGPQGQVTERDSMLITYGDQVQAPGTPPLRALAEFCTRYLGGLVTCLHVLPFYPYTSDDGFSVVDYRQVEPSLGTWEEIIRLGAQFRLMFDAVINHVSVQSAWFQAFLRDDEVYRDYFITVEGQPDLSQVVRPRALPLLTRFGPPERSRAVWTTFSVDQADLNYHEPRVLLDIIDLLLFYASRGAEFIRLDAIAYLWKEIGTTCIHLPQTHHVIQLFRAVLADLAPHVKLITETNVPHADNVAYFGDGTNEAHLVYNFALPPLVLHTLRAGDARVLTRWAGSLGRPSSAVTFFNFLASHDGIGLNPARGLLRRADLDALVQQALAHGGLVAYKDNADGTQSPYELNINYFDALSDPAGSEPLHIQIDRFMAAQAIMLSVAGLPGIYFHSLFGSRGWPEGVRQTGRNRSINRQKFERGGLEQALDDPNSRQSQVFSRHRQLLQARAASPAFNPYGAQRAVDCGEAVFALLRTAPGEGEQVLCLQNVSGRPQETRIDSGALWGPPPQTGTVSELITGERLRLLPKTPLTLAPYQTLWLRACDE
jgi:glycosidase